MEPTLPPTTPPPPVPTSSIRPQRPNQPPPNKPPPVKADLAGNREVVKENSDETMGAALDQLKKGGAREESSTKQYKAKQSKETSPSKATQAGLGPLGMKKGHIKEGGKFPAQDFPTKAESVTSTVSPLSMNLLTQALGVEGATKEANSFDELLTTEVTFCKALLSLTQLFTKRAEQEKNSALKEKFLNLALSYAKGAQESQKIIEHLSNLNKKEMAVNEFFSRKILGSYCQSLIKLQEAREDALQFSDDPLVIKLWEEIMQDEEANANLPLTNYLIQPIQRFPRIGMFIKNLKELYNEKLSKNNSESAKSFLELIKQSKKEVKEMGKEVNQAQDVLKRNRLEAFIKEIELDPNNYLVYRNGALQVRNVKEYKGNLEQMKNEIEKGKQEALKWSLQIITSILSSSTDDMQKNSEYMHFMQQFLKIEKPLPQSSRW